MKSPNQVFSSYATVSQNCHEIFLRELLQKSFAFIWARFPGCACTPWCPEPDSKVKIFNFLAARQKIRDSSVAVVLTTGVCGEKSKIWFLAHTPLFCRLFMTFFWRKLFPRGIASI